MGRRQQYGAGGLGLVSCSLLVVVAGTGWSWLLLIWGIGVTVLSIAGSRYQREHGFVSLGLSPQEQATAIQRGRARDRSVYPPFMLTVVGVAILAAGIPSAWPDVALSGYLVVFSLVLPQLMLPRIRRRVAAAATRTDMSDQ